MWKITPVGARNSLGLACTRPGALAQSPPIAPVRTMRPLDARSNVPPPGGYWPSTPPATAHDIGPAENERVNSSGRAPSLRGSEAIGMTSLTSSPATRSLPG